MTSTNRSSGLESWALGFGFFASVLCFVSIAAFQICLGASLLLLLVSRKPLEMPPVKAPLALFVGWTVVALVASDDMTGGLPQIKKFFVLLMLPLIYTLFRSTSAAVKLMEGWFAVGVITVGVGFVQFYLKWQRSVEVGEPFLQGYEGDRITGLMSHWMTFSETLLLIVAALASYALFRGRGRSGEVLWPVVLAWLTAGVVLSYTRSVWIAGAVLVLYFAAVSKPRLLLLAPIVALVLVVVAPDSVQTRIRSIASPSASSSRVIMWRTGAQMIEAHPWTGVGLEQVGLRFAEFMPADVPDELPPAYYAHLHNTFIHYGAERGLVVVLALLWLFGKILWNLSNAVRRAPPGSGDARFLLQAAIAGTVGVVIISMFNVSIGDSEVMGAWLALVAVGYRAAESVSE